MNNTSIIWGSELSPFTLKIQSLLEFSGIPYRLLPTEGGRIENFLVQTHLELAKKLRKVERFPEISPLDEYPLVPYFSEDGLSFQFDSSAIAHWIDNENVSRVPKLFPDAPALHFLALLIDEAFDDFGLYMVHHNRWVVSSNTVNAGERLAHEFRRVLPPGLGWLMAKKFSARQTVRLPYLFSVAPFTEAWPETHSLLNTAWKEYLHTIEGVLSQQPFLLGDRFTIADASAYGQLSMNLKDPTAAALLRNNAPITYEWLCSIRDGKHGITQASAQGERPPSLSMGESIKPLLHIIMQTYSSLMVQNQHAYETHKNAGDTLFNEGAFDQSKALYDGELMGHAFRSVAKSFQVRSWMDVCDAWGKLTDDDQECLKSLIDQWELFENHNRR